MSKRLYRTVRTVSFAALTLFFIVFAVDNRAVVAVSLFPLPLVADMPLFLFALMCFFLGAVFGMLGSRAATHKLKAQLREAQTSQTALQNQLQASHAERVTKLPPAA